MSRFVIPGAESLSEFVGLPTHQYGDCGEDATLMALHAINPAKWPLTPAGLGSLDNAEESAGYADAGGAQNIPHMDAYLTKLGIPHTTVGYADYTEDKLHNQLRLFLSAHSPDPVIAEYSDAGAGFPDDEAGVKFHFNMYAGEDDSTPVRGYVGGYLRGDGDSNTDSGAGAMTPLILTPWEEINAAQPIAYIVVHAATPPAPQPQPIPPTAAQEQAASVAREYVVRSGDTLASIAAAFGCTSAQLLALNADRLIHGDALTTNQVLLIPAQLS